MGHKSCNISHEYTGHYSDAYAINKDLKDYFSKSTASLRRSKRSRKSLEVCQKCFATKDLLRYYFVFIIRIYQGNLNLTNVKFGIPLVSNGIPFRIHAKLISHYLEFKFPRLLVI